MGLTYRGTPARPSKNAYHAEGSLYVQGCRPNVQSTRYKRRRVVTGRRWRHHFATAKCSAKAWGLLGLSGAFRDLTPLIEKATVAANIGGPDQTRPDQIRPDQTRSDQLRPDQTRSNQITPDQTRSDQTMPDKTRPDQIRPDQTRPSQTRLDQIRPDKTSCE